MVSLLTWLFGNLGWSEIGQTGLVNFLGGFLNGALMLGWLAFLPLIFVYAERKISAHMQDRLGPMEVGWKGILQTVADTVKLLIKEDLRPERADPVLFRLAPMLIVGGSYAAFCVIPFSPFMQVADLNLGLFYVLSVTSLAVVAILMAGWASNNKWSLLGAMRSAAQIVSYEIPSILSLVVVILAAGTLSMQSIAEQQAGGFWNWFVFNPFALVASVVFFISALAETNRTPFDLPEAESELVAGYLTEYSGLRWSMFFMAEYAAMFVACAILVAVFFGAYHSGLPFQIIDSAQHPLLSNLASAVIFVSKCFVGIFVMMWLRWTLPRLRVDQLMSLCWKYLVPISFLCIFGSALWSSSSKVKTYFENIYYALITILIGMKITIRQFFRPSVTLQYPKERMAMPPGTRNRLFCDIDDCTGCLACARICPVDCIEIESSKRDASQVVFTSTGVRLKLDVPKFNINMALCCYCNLCTEVCPTECLKMTPAYEFAVFDRGDLLYQFDRSTLVTQGLLPPQRPDFQPPPKVEKKKPETKEAGANP